MVRTDNLNIERFFPLTPPDTVKAELPMTAKAADTVVSARADLTAILTRRDSRLIMIVGPCSIHSRAETMEYARRLKRLQAEVCQRILLIMRAYFEKPRTILGWKGLIYDPELNDSYDIEAGLRLARKILLEINELGLPVGTEILEPIIPQYLTDLVSWAAIGARTTESQTHRQLASGLSMPIGFKNATDGFMKGAVDAIKTATSSHAFIGITGEGRAGIFKTRGNALGHLVLRGGSTSPNYTSEYIAFARELMKKSGLVPNLLVDCSHGNSRKDPRRQGEVLRDVLRQHLAGETSIQGVMLESYLETGRQEVPADPGALRPGLSITDACLGWDETEKLIRETAEQLGNAPRS